MDLVNQKIFVAGHRGLVGSAVVRQLQKKGAKHLLLKSRSELDLRNPLAVSSFFDNEKPEIVVLAAARVGGIGANSDLPVEFLLENLQIQNNVISSAANYGVQKLLFLGSSCIYPKEAKIPITENQLLTGSLEKSNDAYAIAKIAGIKLCEAYRKEYNKNFISVMPTNLYGPNDYYDFHNSHVIPAMMLKVRRSKLNNENKVEFWGSGNALREFLYSDDLAAALLTCLEKYNEPQMINVGSGEEVSIRQLAELICEVCEYDGKIEWNSNQPDGTMRKLLDSSKIFNLNWRPTIQLKDGLRLIASEVAQHYDILSSKQRMIV